MKEMTNSRPQDTLRQLCRLFPTFSSEWAEQGMPPEDGLVDNVYYEWTHHQVVNAFLNHLSASGVQFADDQFRQLGAWLNAAVEVDGALENAVSTCFLEHMHQVGLDRIISPHLSEKAKSRSHA
jgi:hypothetical protein